MKAGSDQPTTAQDLREYADELEALGTVSGHPIRLFSSPGLGVAPASRAALQAATTWAWQNRRALFDIADGFQVQEHTAALSGEAKALAENIRKAAQDYVK